MGRTRLRKWIVVLGLGGAVVAVAGYLAVGSSHTRPPGTFNRARSASVLMSMVLSSAGQAKGFAFGRDDGIRADLFGGGSVSEGGSGTAGAAQPPPLILLAPGINLMPGDPLADYVYAGSATRDGEMVALIENRITHQGEYVAEDALWQGHRVLFVSPDSITISINGAPRTIAKSDAFTTVPLSADAPGNSPQIAAEETATRQESAQIDLIITNKLGGLTLLEQDGIDSGVIHTQMELDIAGTVTATDSFQLQSPSLPPVSNDIILINDFDGFIY